MTTRVSILLMILLVFPWMVHSQSYTSFFTGDEANVQTSTLAGVCLMGGASEQDDAMRKFLMYANGGDVVVLRASGSDGYNDYLYSDLGVEINSVETILMHNANAGTEEYIIRKVAEAEALWFAGGDQYRYAQYIKDTPLEDTINYLVNVKGIPIGGTSAGMAIMGEGYFPAANGTITSKEAISNPYHSNMSIGFGDFLHVPFMERTITDTHYDRVDSDETVRREGRLITFMARLAKDFDVMPRGIACEEYTAVFIDSAGIASVYGDSGEDDFAYFLQASADSAKTPEVCAPGEPLTWHYGQRAIKVFKVKGNESGSGYLDLKNWKNGSGGEWMYSFVFLGKYYERQPTSTEEIQQPENHLKMKKMPDGSLQFFANKNIERVMVYGIGGRKLKEQEVNSQQWTFKTSVQGALILAFHFKEGMEICKVVN